MTTTVRDMIEMLQDFDPDSEVRMAFQPSWPFEYALDTDNGPLVEVGGDNEAYCPECGIYRPEGPSEDCETCADENAEQLFDDDGQSVVYIVPGDQIGYLPQAAADAMGW